MKRPEISCAEYGRIAPGELVTRLTLAVGDGRVLARVRLEGAASPVGATPPARRRQAAW